MAWASATGDSATFAEVVAGKKTPAADREAAEERRVAAELKAAKEAKEAFEALGNMFLNRLPREIRDMVYKELFLCSVPIVPGYIHWQDETRWSRSARKQYKYQYDSGRENNPGQPWYGIDRPTEYGQNFTPCKYFPLHIPVTWITEPSSVQEELVAKGESVLPSTVEEESGGVTEHQVLDEDGPGIQILNSRICQVNALRGVEFLRSCKQVEQEGSRVLYGDNTFVLDARGDASWGNRWNAEEKIKFRQTRWRVPGLPHPNGIPQTDQETTKALDQLFKKGWQPKFIYEDPFLRFCSIVGRKNISLLRKVKIEGHFRTCHREYTNPAGLVRLLPIYTTVFKNVCQDLWSLSLHMGTDTRFLYMGRGFRFSTRGTPHLTYRDGKIDGAKKDEDVIDKTVARLVRSLPSLLQLQLGDYKTSIPEGDMKWGKARRWVEHVKNRHQRLGQVEGVEVTSSKEASLGNTGQRAHSSIFGYGCST